MTDFTAEGILLRMKADLKSEDTKMEGSFTMDNLQAVSEELARFYSMGLTPLITLLSERQEDMGTSGNERHYMKWAKEAVDGEGERIAGNAKVNSPRDGTGNVFIAIISVRADTPTEAEIQAVQEYIDTRRPVGANPVVFAAEGIPVDISCSVRLQTGYGEETVKRRITEAIEGYLTDIAFSSGVLILNFYRICSLVTGIDGVEELVELYMNNGKESLEAEYDKFFLLNKVVIAIAES